MQIRNTEFITREYLLTYFNYHKELGVLLWKNHWHPSTRSRVVGKIAGSIQNGYRNIETKNKIYPIHRLIWFLEKNNWPTMIDHIDGNKLNNTIENLRGVNHSRANQQNRKKHREGKLIGTCFYKNGWISQITVETKNVYLGRFKTEREAHERYAIELQRRGL